MMVTDFESDDDSQVIVKVRETATVTETVTERKDDRNSDSVREKDTVKLTVIVRDTEGVTDIDSQ